MMTSEARTRYNATVLVTSDTCYKDPSLDTSGKYVEEQLISLEYNVKKHVVQDDKEAITASLRAALTDNSLIITVGGTGLCPRDVTPEASSVLYDRHCYGISTALLMTSLRYSPQAALSRLTAGIAGDCLIINFPGKLKACRECFAYLRGFLDHALEQVKFNPEAIKATHKRQDNLLSKMILEGSLAGPPSISTLSAVERDFKQLIDLDPTTPPFPSELPEFTDIEKAEIDSLYQTPHPTKNLGSYEQDDKHTESVLWPSYTKIKSHTTESPYPLVDYTDVLDIMGILSHKACRGIIIKPLNNPEAAFKLLGDTIADDMITCNKIPPFPVSTMDGYVVNIPLNMINMVPAIKSVPAFLVENLDKFERLQRDIEFSSRFFCYQVNTGGRVPKENFVVVPVEKTSQRSNIGITILEMKLNNFIRAPGSDLNDTDIMKSGTVIGPVELSLIQLMEHKSVKVVKKPTIGVLSTGDELIEFHNERQLYQVIDINAPLLSASLKLRNYPIINCGISKDNPQDIHMCIVNSLKKCDILIVTGGASMGSKDYVKDVIKNLGATLHFGRVNIKPGKPTALASMMMEDKQKFIFSLPGNPVSAYITTLVLVVPFVEHGIRSQLGYDIPLSLHAIGDFINVKIEYITDLEGSEEYEFDGRLEFMRARIVSVKETQLNVPYPITISAKQQSSRLLSLKDCDCLMMVDPTFKGKKLHVGQTFPALKLKN